MPPFTSSQPVGHRPKSPAICAAGLGALFSLLAVASAVAQEKEQTTTTSGKLSLESDFSFGLVGNSNFRQRSEEGKASAWDMGARDVVSFQAHEGFLLRFGLEFHRYNFDVPTTLNLPSKLQESNLVVGADLQLGDAWIVRVEAQPGYYGGNTELRTSNFDCPIVLGASYFASSDLQFVVGLSVDPQRKYPVLPGIGFRYQYNSNWVFDFILPQPRIEYNLDKSILLYVGGDLQGSTFRVNSEFGDNHGVPKLNDAWVDYTQVRVGVGASWKIRPSLTLEVEAGIVPIQEFDFHRADIRASATEIPPYGGVVLKAAF
ncbi:hypothetical protein EV701_116179 [Chthoniobacter flavus]|nr:DUF6268 family outer membrane beta-barrel protein [Chthoniobacter flavus]TCO88806.1 hypothetical protein EV701_116179 [Chthoniobacter flavus]